MKKITMTLVILLGLTMGSFTQNGGLFGKGATRDGNDNTPLSNSPMLPGSHGGDDDTGAPLGTGTALLLGFGAAYLVSKRNRKE